jgi:hypothetical protein
VSARSIGDPAVRSFLEPAIRELGLRVQRLSVESIGGAHPTYELSLYVKPPSAVSAEVYASRLAPLAKAVIPAAFAKFDDIAWVDVCQERAGTPDGVDDATPVTRLEVNRHDSGTVDWKKFDLVSLLALKNRSQHDVSILANDGVEQTRAWRAALSQSRPLDG